MAEFITCVMLYTLSSGRYVVISTEFILSSRKFIALIGSMTDIYGFFTKLSCC